jgi:hypothetical protein
MSAAAISHESSTPTSRLDGQPGRCHRATAATHARAAAKARTPRRALSGPTIPPAEHTGTATDLTSLSALVAASRTAQGLGPTVTDPKVLRELGRLLADHDARNHTPSRGASAQSAAARAWPV